MATAPDSVLAARHARLRWIGAPLLLTGVVLVAWAIRASIFGGTWWNFGFGMLGAGMALASFGANHDTAMALAFRARDEELGDKLRAELEEELERDRDEVVGLQASPKVAMVLPVVAMSIQGWVCTRLLELGW